jgi:hypothetical protein
VAFNFAFPTAAEHVSAHATLEVAEIAKSVVPANGLHSGMARIVSGFPDTIIVMPKHVPKVTPVYISV